MYGKKHKLDLDDGSGGSRSAGKKYMIMWKKHDTLVNNVNKDATSKTIKYMKDKYGEKKYKQIGRQNTAVAVASIGGVVIGTGVTINLTKKRTKNNR